jgi:hypothetical protein
MPEEQSLKTTNKPLRAQTVINLFTLELPVINLLTFELQIK